MNPVRQIGRYQIPIASVVIIAKRTGWRGFFFPGYDCLLANGLQLRLNEQEKQELDEARGNHQKVMEVWGMISEMKRNNQASRPA